jgi:hypothetical protein
MPLLLDDDADAPAGDPSSAPAPDGGAEPPTAPTTRRGDRGLVVLFTAATFASATLLFLVQPMVAKVLLPELGGSAAVWNTASVFFQAVLLAGYAFAHVSLRTLGPRRQPWLQLVVIAAGLAVLPIALPDGWRAPITGSPIGWTLLVLAAMVGLPFFVLSTVSPTLQRWFSTTDHPDADDPYFLYAAGNVGSLLALLGYPLLIEPRVDLDDQAAWWAVGYAAFGVLAMGCAIAARRRTRFEATTATAGMVVTGRPPLSWRTRLRWIGFAAVPSALMLGVTRHISSEVAAMPLLWVIPLALYLGTFVVAFGKRPDRAVAISSRALKLLVVPLALSMYGLLSSLAFSLLLNLGVFAAAAMVAHGRLSQERPAPERLTDFYLMLSVGGVVGGATAALLAPVAFTSILEYPVVVIASLALLPAAAFDGGAPSRKRAALVGASVLATAIGAVVVRSSGTQQALQAAMLVAALGAALAYVLTRTPKGFAAALGVVLGVGVLIPANSTTYQERTFYGVHRVYVDQANGDRHVLLNGSTVHGMEYPSGDHAGKPTTYYHPTGPIGRWFAAHEDDGPRRVGVIGLGAGALAWYGREGDRMDFYEIDPSVVEIAERPDLFTFVDDSAAEIDVHVGDGRLLVADSSMPPADALVIDAFSGDSIPAHLLTTEAVELYLDAIADDGALVFHISNRFFDFTPVVARLAEESGLVAYQSADEPTPEEEAQGKLGSTWVVVARTADDAGIADEPAWERLDAPADAPLWTDQRSDLLSILR